MAITDKLSAIADSMREADGSSRTYNMVEMAERPAVWQQTIAEAITAKGVDTLPDASFDTMAVNIGLLGGGDCKHLHTTVSIPYTTAESIVTLLPRSALVEAGILTGANTSLEDEWERFVVEITINPTGLTRGRMYVFKTISFSLGTANGSISSAGVVSILAYTVRLAKESTSSSASPVVRVSNSTLKSEGGYGYPSLRPGEGLNSANISTSPTYNGNYTIDVYVAGKK